MVQITLDITGEVEYYMAKKVDLGFPTPPNEISGLQNYLGWQETYIGLQTAV